jgi:hypothetical protein
MEKLKNFFYYKKDYFYFIILILILIYLMWLNISNKKEYNEKYIQNIKSLQDTITVLKNNIYTKTQFVSELKELKELNKNLYDSIVKIKKQLKGNIINYISYKQEINYDSIKMILKQNTVKKINDSLYVLNSRFDSIGGDLSNGFKISGKIHNTFDIKNKYFYGNINIDTISIFSYFKVGTYYDKKTKLQKIFIQPSNPNIKITGLEGVDIKSFNKKKFNIGLGVGYGIVYKDNLTLSPFVGVYCGYNLFGF